MKPGYELEFEETFEGDKLDESRWLPYYLPHWSSRERAAARYELRDGRLHLRVDQDQEPWCPEFDGDVRVSSLQTGLYEGQHRFSPEAVVREPKETKRLYTPLYGLIEIRCKAIADPGAMVALWMIGYEDEPDRSGEICVCEIFGRDVKDGEVSVGMGVHPFDDPRIEDDFAAERVAIDATEFHVYSARWTRGRVAFSVDGEVVRTVTQAPAYPMQLMLSVYDFPGEGSGDYPKEFVVDWVRGYRPL